MFLMWRETYWEVVPPFAAGIGESVRLWYKPAALREHKRSWGNRRVVLSVCDLCKTIDKDCTTRCQNSLHPWCMILWLWFSGLHGWCPPWPLMLVNPSWCLTHQQLPGSLKSGLTVQFLLYYRSKNHAYYSFSNQIGGIGVSCTWYLIGKHSVP